MEPFQILNKFRSIHHLVKIDLAWQVGVDYAPGYLRFLFFGINVWGTGAVGELTPDVRITDKTPPTMLVVADNDPGVKNSVYMYLALKNAKIPAEMHIYSEGGHGFGMNPGKGPHTTWTKRVEDWLDAQHVLALCEQPLAQVRAEESGAAGDQDALFEMHECPSASAAFRSGGLPIR